MERSSLARILADVSGLENAKDVYKVPTELRLDVHVGDAGRPLTFSELASLTLEDHFLVLVSRDDEARHYFEYDGVVGVSVKPMARAGRRTGFS